LESEASFENALEAELEEDREEAALEAQEAESDAQESEADFAELESEILMELEEAPRITYSRGDFAEENFSNARGHAVFSRRARGQEIVRFEKRLQSSGGTAVTYVKGVRKNYHGKEVTDQGLSAATVVSNPGVTVEALQASAPELIDDNIAAIRHFPVVPSIHVEGGVDEYGDPIEH